MPHAITFDTLSYAKKLISVGVPQEQDEVQAETFSEIIESELATKRDMKELEISMKCDMKELEQKLIIKLGFLIAASIAIVATLVKLL